MNNIQKQIFSAIMFYLGGSLLLSLSALSFIQGIIFHLDGSNPLLIIPYYFSSALALISALLVFSRATTLLKAVWF
ncbi:MAG: hypothetical protein COV47_01515 [Candidatus Diapherotrites archaeon CG11_big_fil_rev_8_21_14_0_20_37_9]|nr:MAG: hypothetical protein COV47_01515 [Candidatus Diapherotrites archaeon CG11_big_fil_rev_8_21_14_0_20_37_9]